MANNVTLVSSPDFFIDGDFKIMLVGISDACTIDIINYFSTQSYSSVIYTITNDDYDWIMQSAQVCDLILLDLDKYSKLPAGWLLKEKTARWTGSVKLDMLNHKKISSPLQYIIEHTKEIV